MFGTRFWLCVDRQLACAQAVPGVVEDPRRTAGLAMDCSRRLPVRCWQQCQVQDLHASRLKQPGKRREPLLRQMCGRKCPRLCRGTSNGCREVVAEQRIACSTNTGDRRQARGARRSEDRSEVSNGFLGPVDDSVRVTRVGPVLIEGDRHAGVGR